MLEAAQCHAVSLCLCSVKGERVYTPLSIVCRCCQTSQALLKDVGMFPDESGVAEGCCYVTR